MKYVIKGDIIEKIIKGLFLTLVLTIGNVSAIEEIDCPSNTDRPTTVLAYAYFTITGNTVTYKIDVADKAGGEIGEYCVYPTPGFTGPNDDLTALYDSWSIDRPGSKTYFGFDSRPHGTRMPLDGSRGTNVGRATYTSGLPSSVLIMLHLYDDNECGVGNSCWRMASTSPLPEPTTPTPTATPTVTPTATPTATPTVTPTATPTVTPTPTTTPVGDIQPPTQPLCPAAIATGPTTIDFSWWASTDNVAVAGYKVYRSVDNINFYLANITTDTIYHDTGLTTGTTYYYAVEAFDTSGNPSLPSDIVYATPRDMQAPIITVPLDMTIEATSAAGATVTFTATAIDDIDDSIMPTCIPASGYTFPLGYTTVTCTATDNGGNTGSAIFTIRVVDTTPPTAPSGLTATAISTSRIDLSWTASYDAVGVTQYRIYRSLTIDGIYTAIATVPRTATTYQNTGLLLNTTYYYYVVAYDRAGHISDPSNIASATTFSPTPTPTPPTPGPTETPGTPGPTPPTPPPPPPYDGPPIITVPESITAEATSPNGASAAFAGFVSAWDNEDNEYKLVTCDPVSGSTFPLGTTIVMCWADDSAGHRTSDTFTISVVDTTPPTPPSGLTATAMSTSRIDLSWTASYDAVGVTQYQVYRSTNGVTFTLIRTLPGTQTTYQNTGLLPNTTYYYYVRANDAAGNPSSNSNTASARTFPLPPSPPPGPIPTPGPTIPPGPPGPEPTETPNPCIPQTGNTPRGQDVETIPAPTIGVRFDAVLECGDTTAVAYYDNQWTPLPSNYMSRLYYDIDTTAAYISGITIDITYSGSDIPAGVSEQTLRIFHYENGAWVDITTSLDTVLNRITGRVTSLSPFSIGGIAGSGSGGGSVGNVIIGSGLNISALILLSICLILVSILRLRKK